MKSTTRILSIVLAVIMLVTAVPIVGFSTDSDASSSSSDLPSSYTIDTKYITPVRNQGNEGVCWAFGMTAALEIELIQMGYPNAYTILSPLYESYSLYDGTVYSGSGDAVILLTGNFGEVGSYSFEPTMELLNGRGPLYEYVAPYSEIGNYTIGSDIAYSSILTVRGTETYDPYTDAERIKALLCEGHAASFAYYSCDGLNNYYPRLESISSNHSVCLVGYDDNYSKDNFKGINGTPEGDGAWIIKNSWGVDASKGVPTGYTYVSYYSSIENVTFYTDITVNDGTLDMYSYDNGYSIMSDRQYRGSVTMANVFTCERDGYIDSANFLICEKTNLDMDYTVKVYRLDDGYRSPTDGHLIASGASSNTDGHNGAFNTYLVASEQLHKGDKFSVCIELTGENCYVPIDTYESFDNNHVSYTVAEKGQSYICYEGKWTDVSADGKSNIRIKAYISTEPVCEATLNSTYYESFADAVKDAKAGDVISLLKSVECDPVTISKDITIRFRGYDVTVNASGSENAFTLNNCNVKMDYGRIFTGGNAAICVNGGSLTASYMSFPGKEYAVISNDAKLTLNSITYDGFNPFSFTGGQAVLDSCLITAIDEMVVSYGCKVTIEGGTYSGTELYQDNDGDIIVTAGLFDYKLDNKYVDSESYQEKYDKTRYITKTREVNVVGHDDIMTLQEALYDDGNVIKLCKNITATYAPIIGDVNTTLDLNGHNLTKVDIGTSFIDGLEKTVTIMNSSSTRSTITVSNFITQSSNGTVIIGDNIDVIATQTAYGDGEYMNVTVSDKSTVSIVSETSTEKIIATPYFNAQKQYCEKYNITIYGEAKSVKYVYTGTAENVDRTTTTCKYQADGEYKDAAGNKLGSWTRICSREMRVVDDDKMLATLTMDVFKDQNGKISIQYLDDLGMTMKTRASTDVNGVTNIYTECYGRVSENVSSKLVDVGKMMNKLAVNHIKAYTENYTKGIKIMSYHNVNKVLGADLVNGLFDEGYDVGVATDTYSIVMKCGTGKLTGDTVLCMEKVGRSELTNKENQAIGTGVAYKIYAKVNGVQSDVLPCKCTVGMYRYHSEGDRISILNDDGSLSNVDSTYANNTTTFSVDSPCIIAVNAESSVGTAPSTVMYIILGVVVVLAVVGLAMFLRPKH